jgi:ubiquinone/menaquinone biosynthesis C-methylase UbiE
VAPARHLKVSCRNVATDANTAGVAREPNLTNDAFRELEHSGWTKQAASYDLITPVTNQAIDPLLASFGPVNGLHLLEVASGPGHLAGRAAELGAEVEAVDFASTMVDRARARYPNVNFREGDAENLDCADDTFDGVVCAFGLLHLGDPERAISEAFRVLRPGGRYTCSVWCTPEEGGEFFGFLMGAIQQHGDLNVLLPPAPSFYRFADSVEAQSAMTRAGFIDYQRNIIPVVWRGNEPQDAIDVIYKSTVRTKALIEAQADAAREAIHAAIISGIEAYRSGDGYEVALSAVMFSGCKPG